MLKVLIVGCGNMGTSHALAYARIANCQIVALVAPSSKKRQLLAEQLQQLGIAVKQYNDFYQGLQEEKPDIVCIASYSETHAEFTIAAMQANAHVFLEKPIATNLQDAYLIWQMMQQSKRKLVIGLILRHHPSWQRFINVARTLGKPLVMRMNLNQQSSGERWHTHLNLMKSLSPVVDCGVHYVDIMCQMVKAKPVTIYAIGANLANIDMYNYGMLQVKFSDGSVGWYEAGWGPMISTNAYFIKDVIGPNGCASIVPNADSLSDSANIDSHTAAENIVVHYSSIDKNYNFTQDDEIVKLSDEPDHIALCQREQQYLIDAIINDHDLTRHLQSAIDSLAIVLAADESIATGRVVNIEY